MITLGIVEPCESAERSGVPLCRRSLKKLPRAHEILLDVALAVTIKTGEVENGTNVALVRSLGVQITCL